MFKVDGERVFENPSREEFAALIQIWKSYGGRAILDIPSGNLFMWESFGHTHDEIAPEIGVTNYWSLYVFEDRIAVLSDAGVGEVNEMLTTQFRKNRNITAIWGPNVTVYYMDEPL